MPGCMRTDMEFEMVGKVSDYAVQDQLLARLCHYLHFTVFKYTAYVGYELASLVLIPDATKTSAEFEKWIYSYDKDSWKSPEVKFMGKDASALGRASDESALLLKLLSAERFSWWCANSLLDKSWMHLDDEPRYEIAANPFFGKSQEEVSVMLDVLQGCGEERMP